MPATEVTSVQQFDTILGQTPREKLVVIDFHATWCGPCKTIAPVYLKLSNTLLHATFLKIDVDKVQAVSQRYSVRAMPTFLFLKNGQKIDELKGADGPGLTEKATRHAGPAPRSFPSSSGSSTEGLTSLSSLIDSRGLECLNEASAHPLRSILGSSTSPSAYLESDADAQLLITLPFLQPTRLRSIIIGTSAEGVKEGQAPKRVKLFVNRPSLGFDEAENEPGTQEWEVKSGKEGEKVDLRLVKFQGVQSLHIFVMSNGGDEDVTRIDSIDVFGEAMDSTSNGKLEKVDDGHGH